MAMTQTNHPLIGLITDSAHAIRNELNVVTGHAYHLAHDPSLSAAQQQAAASIYNAAFRVVHHLDQLVSQSRLTDQK